MSSAPANTEVDAAPNLRRLLHLRAVILAGQVLAALIAYAGFEMPLPWAAIVCVWIASSACSAFAGMRLRSGAPISRTELYLQVMADVTLLSLLLYFTGGPVNPLGSLLLLPLVFAAVALPRRHTWTVAAAVVAAYSALMIVHEPLSKHAAHSFALHLAGMWFGFVLSAGLIAFFVVRMAAALRDHERKLAALRERELRDERLVALGTLAAGAAHELGTPLATMAVLAKELESELADVPHVPRRMQLLRGQVDRCKTILAGMAGASELSRADAGKRSRLDDYLEALLNEFVEGRGEVTLTREWSSARSTPLIVVDRALTQALLNVLNNAADASPHAVNVYGRWNADELILEICDSGPGLAPEARAHAGEPFFTTKGTSGMGLGLFLARATMTRLGGELELSDRDGGGACVRIRLPLAPLRVEES